MKVENGKVHLKSLEYFLTDRCNLRCEHCSASSPFLRNGNLAELDDFQRDLRNLEPVLRSEQIKFLGGEPLLHKSVCDFLRAAKESGVFGRVRVTTNGVLLPRMSDEFWDLADVVEISRYGGKGQPGDEAIEELRAKATAHGTELESNPISRFMKSTSETPIDDSQKVKQIFLTCGEANSWSCHMLHRGKLYRCSRVHTLDRYLTELDIEHLPFTDLDGLPIDDRADLLEDIREYMQRTEPLNACSFCLGTAGVWVDNRQLSTAEVRERKEGVKRNFDPSLLVPPKEAMLRGVITTWAAAGKPRNQPD